MRNDQDLHQLFRARLPIATLPKEFADRLTKAVLDEVAQLHQIDTLRTGCTNSYLEEATPFTPVTKPAKSSLFPCTTKAIAFLLLLNFLLWPFLQGCTLPTTATASQPLPLTELHIPANLLATITPAQAISKQPANHTAAIILNAQRTERPLRSPPLLPIKPQLPIVEFLPQRLTSKVRLIHMTPPNTGEELTTLHGPPGMAHDIPTVITMTMPYEPQSTTQDDPAAPTPLPSEQQPEPPAIATATPTADILLLKPTGSPTLPALSSTPVLSIFEPTATPSAAVETPIGATTAAPTAMPTAMPTICLQPWQTSAAEPPSAPTVTAAPTVAPDL